MSKRIVIVGGVAAGASAAAKARRMSEDAEIVLVEAGPHVSFANCGLPYYVGGEIADRNELFIVTEAGLRMRFNVDVRLRTRATAVDREAKAVTVEGPDGQRERIGYDRLILATGSRAVRPPIDGLDRPNVFTVRSVPDADAIVAHLEATGEGGRGLVIGGGYIGLEAAEQLQRRGLAVTIVEMMPQVMTALDPELAGDVQAAMEQAGCEVVLGDGVARIEDRDGQAVAVTRAGREIPFDVGIQAVGVRPNVELAESAEIVLGETGAIRVDEFQRTSDPSIYAAGDNSETRHLVLGRAVNIPLAGPANKAGRVAGANAALDLLEATSDDRRRLRMPGVLGTAILRAGGLTAGVTGLTETQARAGGIEHAVIYLPGTSHATYYPGAKPILLKVLYDPRTGRLLGGQAVGAVGVDKRIDVIATAIVGKLTVEQLGELDLCYSPQYGSAKDVAVLAGLAGANERAGVMPAMTPAELLDELAGDDPPVLLDVRTKKEFDAGHVEGALHVPVDELRGRLDEVPADRRVAVACGSGYRSYVAQRILLGLGRSDVRNVLGGNMAIQKVQAARRARGG